MTCHQKYAEKVYCKSDLSKQIKFFEGKKRIIYRNDKK